MSCDIVTVRKCLKWKLKGDKTAFLGHETEYKQIRDLFHRTSECGESNSGLLIGPRGSGKTTMVRSILKSLDELEIFRRNTIVVQLNGLVHTDDALALDSISLQMQMENIDMDGKVFGSFAEKLCFLLETLKSGDREHSKAVIFVLEEFDLFCAHHNQTLLYNLFDVAQSAAAPICVLGSTCHLDVIELLEKRVKSRFSHRQYFLFPSNQFSTRLELFSSLMTISKHDSRYKLSKTSQSIWNSHVKDLASNKLIQSYLERHFEYDTTIAAFKLFLIQIVARLSEDYDRITQKDFEEVLESYEVDSKVVLLCGLSVLELCLVVAMKHHSEIYDRDPFNFEMILMRFNKFAATTQILQNISRDVVQKGFERILQLEFIAPVSTSSTNNTLKQFRLFWLLLTFGQIKAAVEKYSDLPTDIDQWARSSPI